MESTRGMEWISSKKTLFLFTVVLLPTMIFENFLMEVDITFRKIKELKNPSSGERLFVRFQVIQDQTLFGLIKFEYMVSLVLRLEVYNCFCS
jgi:hypothetical protein